MDADRIVLKDGTIEESDRIWESEKYVHFILQGTQTVEIRFAKEIVARIESGHDAPPALTRASNGTGSHPAEPQRRGSETDIAAGPSPSSAPLALDSGLHRTD